MVDLFPRTVWLFGKPYWWDREDGRLTLKPAMWINPLSEARIDAGRPFRAHADARPLAVTATPTEP